MREENIHIFTPEMLEKMAYIWTRSSISLIDVRHQSIYPAQPLRQYKMPSSMLVYAYGGIANKRYSPWSVCAEQSGGAAPLVRADDGQLEPYNSDESFSYEKYVLSIHV